MTRTLGSISIFPYDFDPAGWARCDGSTLPGDASEPLFSLLFDTFGGDPNQFTFGLPNLDGAAPKGCRYCISLFGEHPRGRYEGVLGQTVIWAIADPTPTNLVECNGQSLPENQNMYLKHLIGGRFGGAEAGKFKLPDLSDRYPANCRYMLCRDGYDPTSPRDPFVGEIVLLPFEVPDTGPQKSWQLCDGGQFSASENPILARLLGNRFGGAGRFPDLRAAAPPKCNYYMSLKGVMPQRS
jgi:microcystin-dependent protein